MAMISLMVGTTEVGVSRTPDGNVIMWATGIPPLSLVLPMGWSDEQQSALLATIAVAYIRLGEQK